MSSLHTNTVIYIGAQKISSFLHLQIEQSIEGHHSFQLLLSQEWFRNNGDGLFAQIKDLFGAPIRVEITPEIQSNKSSLFFGGVVTNISTGKQGSGDAGVCTISGYSPTKILDDDAHTDTFEDRDQAYIAKRILGKYPQNLLEYSLNPNITDSLKYIVQYKESSWQFIKRLASRNGEWCFYDGRKLIYGKHDPTEIKLFHQRDLASFNLQMGLQPANQKMHTYEYESHKPIEIDTTSQNTGTLNQISSHLLKSSDSVYLNKGIQKVTQEMNGSAQNQIRHVALMQRKNKLAQMVTLSGESSNLGLKVGVVVNIVEDFHSNADYGKYFITNLTHICTGNGNYSNHFTSIPSDVAAPAYYGDSYPFCEAQSAFVMDNHDPKGLGRIRVSFSWQDGLSPWIRVVSTAGGADKGFYFMPENGEEVWVDFEGGNPELPYVLGSTYNGNAKTSFGNKGNDLKVIKTRSGHSIEFNDAAGGTSITIQDKSGNIIFFDTKEKHLTISTPETFTINARNLKLNIGEDFVTEVGGNMKTNIGVNSLLTVTEKYEISSAESKESIEGDKTSDIKGDLNLKTAMAKITSSDGDITIKSAGIATLQGKTDAKVNKG